MQDKWGDSDRSLDVKDTRLHCMNKFCLGIGSPKCNFPHQDDPCPQNLELESGRTRGNPDRSLDVQDTCHHCMNNFCQTLGFPESHVPQ